MTHASPPPTDPRLAALHAYGILDSPPERDFDEIAALAAELCAAPIALVSFVDADRQWFKARVGVPVSQTPIAESLCSLAIQQDALFEVGDLSQDPRTRDHPIRRSNPDLRFYAGAPLVTDNGIALGSLCVLDTRPRRLTETQARALTVLGRQVVRQLDARKAQRLAEMRRQEADHRVKNSLQSVAAYARLLGRSATSDEARSALSQVEGRIATVARLHALLHDTEGAAEIALDRYLADVGALLGRSCPPQVRLTVDAGPVAVSAAVATASAIIVNEVLANALKHAFPDGRGGVVTISGSRSPEAYVLDCGDDGVGLKAAHKTGLGLSLIDATAAQIGAEVTQRATRQGHAIRVTIPEEALMRQVGT